MNKNIEAFVVYLSFLRLKITIYLPKKAHIALLLAKKVIVLAKYLDFIDVFFQKLANLLLEQTRANKYAIKLEKGK